MDTRDVIAARIIQLCEARHITPNGLSNIAAVPQSTIKSILNGVLFFHQGSRFS